MRLKKPWSIEKRQSDYRITDAEGKQIISVMFSGWGGDRVSEKEAWEIAQLIVKVPSLVDHMRGVVAALTVEESNRW